MALTESEQAEMDTLELRQLEAKQAAASPKAASQATPNTRSVGAAPASAFEPTAAQTRDYQAMGLGTPKAGDVFNRENVTPEDVKKFENLGAVDRLKLFMVMSGPYVKRELMGDAQGGGAFAVRAAAPAIGQKIGQVTRIPGADRVLGGVGGMIGEFAGERIAGEPVSGGRVLGAFVPGAMRGKSLAGAAGKEIVKETAANAGGNVAAKNLETLVAEHRLASLGEDTQAAVGGVIGTAVSGAIDTGTAAANALAQTSRNAPAEALREQFRQKGYVFIPSKAGSGAAGDAADFLGGASPNSSALANVASLRNQEVTNDLARSYIGAPKDMAFDEVNMAKLIHAAEAPYRAVADISPQAAASLEMFTQANADAKKGWKAYDRNPSPELAKFAQENNDLADLALADMREEAAKAGKSQLVPRLEAARVELAKIHLVDRAINYGDYNVSAKTFRIAKDYGTPLSGDGDLIARMAAANPGITRDASSITTVGSGKIPILSSGVRNLVLSPAGQRVLTGTPAIKNPNEDFIARAVRLGLLSEGRDTTEQPVQP